MKKSKYYVYWNLHKDLYSVRYKGKVIQHLDHIILENVEFKVSDKGRQRVLKEKRKNVHAFVVAEKILEKSKLPEFGFKVKYDPYKYSSFVDSEENPVYYSKFAVLEIIQNKPCLKVHL
jgi:hypothetical protein